MNRKDIKSANNNPAYPKQMLEAIRKFLPQRGLSLVDSDCRIRWTDRMLVITAILMVWIDSSVLTDAFFWARGFVIRMYPTRRRPGRQFRGFMLALKKNHNRLLGLISSFLQSVICDKWLFRSCNSGWAVMGIDGTRITVPRTVANERGYGVFGKDKSMPQQQLTTVFHVGTQLPWLWRSGRGDIAERTHLKEMIPQLPEKTLLLADAGFTGYEVMDGLQRTGHDFIIRVGSNVRLLRKLNYAMYEYDGIVYLWPCNHRKNEPLVLRLVTVIDGSKKVSLLTSVIDDQLLSDAAIAKLYRQRWGIEVMYRSLKQTMDKNKLRSRTPGNAKMELDWLMIGFWLLGLMTLDAAGESRSVHRNRLWSPAKALRVVRCCMCNHRQKYSRIYRLLSAALQDKYCRNSLKKTRDHARKKREKPPGQPKIRMALRSEVLIAQKLKMSKLAS